MILFSWRLSRRRQFAKKYTVLWLIPVGLLLASFLPSPALAQSPTPPPQVVSLPEILRLAEIYNLDLQEARKNMSLSQLDIIIAKRMPNPSFVGNFSAGKIVTVQSNPQQVSLSQLIETAGKRKKRTKIAESQYHLTQLQYNALHWHVRSEVRKAYANLISTEQTLGNLNILTKLLDHLVESAHKRFQNGSAPQFEFMQAELARAQLSAQQNHADAKMEQARFQINNLLGNRLPALFETTEKEAFTFRSEQTGLIPLPSHPLPVKETLYGKALSARADLKAAEQQGVVYNNQLRIERAKRIPDLDLMGGWLTAPTPLENGKSVFYHGGFLQTTVELPVFHHNKQEIQKVQINANQNELQIKNIRQQIRLEIDTAYSQLQAAQSNVTLYHDHLVPSAKKAFQMVLTSYEEGTLSLFDVVMAQHAVEETLNDYLEVLTDYQNGWVDLETAVGVPEENW